MNDWATVLALVMGVGMGWIIGYLDARQRCMWMRTTRHTRQDGCASCRWRSPRARR